MKLKKRKRSKRFRGSRMHGRNAKKAKGKGNYGGKGMAGTGKKAGHKISFTAKYFEKYLGKQGETSKGTARYKGTWINVQDIAAMNIKEFEFKGKVLGDGEILKPVIVKAKSFSSKARDKIEKAGGKAVLLKEKVQVQEKKEKVVKIKKE